MTRFFGALIVSLLFYSFRSDERQERWLAPASADSLYNPYHVEPLTLPQAQEIFAIHCSPCHGNQGDGKGSEAAKLKTHLLSFRDSTVAAQTDGSIYWKIKTGRGEMPGYNNVVSDEQLWQLTEYVRDLSKPFEEQMNPFKSWD